MSAPPSDMPTPPVPSLPSGGSGARTWAERQAKRDTNQLKLLMVFHWVWAGLMVIGIGMIFLHQKLMDMMMSNPEMWEQSESGPPPDELLAVFRYVYLVMGFTMVLSGIMNALSARFVRIRSNRLFSLIVAGLNCLMFPFGTALGVFAIIILLRDSVVERYETAAES